MQNKKRAIFNLLTKKNYYSATAHEYKYESIAGMEIYANVIKFNILNICAYPE